MIDAALQYGWETHAGFTKAFKKEFGFSPSFLEFMLNEIRYIGGEDMNDSCALGTTKQGMSKEVLYNVLVGKMCENEMPYNSSELERVYLCSDRAYAGVKRYSGEEYVTHPMNVAILLTDMGAELDTIYAGMFCDAEKRSNVVGTAERTASRRDCEGYYRAGSF